MLNKIIIKTLPLVPKPIVHIFAKKYIAGDELQDAVKVTQDLMAKGGMSTIDVLGEFVTTKERALHEKEMSSEVLDAIHENRLKTYLSVKPTSIGLGIDEEFAYNNLKELAEKARQYGLFMRIDMENSPYTTKTINLYKKLRDAGFDNLGIVFQAYMKRSEEDIKSLIDYKPSIRLCKGIYNESPEIAYKGVETIRDNFKRLLELIIDNDMYIGIATHDEPLIQYAVEEIKKRKLGKDKYEFQMLLGVREDKRDELLEYGHPLRVYVPFGKDWYGYSSRRLKENPQMAGHVFKAIFGFGK
ncbi:MAG: proline dehydrogenase family protein [Candidatus Kapaibacterium sp.]